MEMQKDKIVLAIYITKTKMEDYNTGYQDLLQIIK